MAFCTQCGHKLRDGVRFCESCGVQVVYDDTFENDNESEEDVDEDEYVEDEVEDGDEDIEGKDLDPNRGYYMTIDGRTATMYADSGQFVRRFNMRANVIQATTSGQTVTIMTDDGYTTLFSWTGMMIRRTKH